ncbi:MAG TPA: DUF3106 domain-containing protein [Stenotrophomonas sp.]|jgi:hypothetical protein
MIRDLRWTGVLVACLAICPILAIAQALPPALDETPRAAVVPGPTAWAELDAAGRADARERYDAWQALSERDRSRLRQAQAQFATLPPDQQQALRTQFDSMDRLHRDSWRLGPQLGAHYAALQPLFGFVPAAQRDVVLALLRSLDDVQLGQLAVIAQRTAPQDRAALRGQLLGLPVGARADWLRTHAGG